MKGVAVVGCWTTEVGITDCWMKGVAVTGEVVSLNVIAILSFLLAALLFCLHPFDQQ